MVLIKVVTKTKVVMERNSQSSFADTSKKKMSDLMNAFEIKMKQENKKKANLLSSIRGKVTFVT